VTESHVMQSLSLNHLQLLNPRAIRLHDMIYHDIQGQLAQLPVHLDA
jgi:hypothetical protein